MSPTARKLVNVHLNMSKAKNFLTNHILLSLWYNGMEILFRDCLTIFWVHKLQDGLTTWHTHADPQGKACVSILSPAIKSSQPPECRRAKRVVNQAETGPIKSSNRCKDSPASASLSDRGFGRIWKSCHLINMQNACRSDEAHLIAVTMVL